MRKEAGCFHCRSILVGAKEGRTCCSLGIECEVRTGPLDDYFSCPEKYLTIVVCGGVVGKPTVLCCSPFNGQSRYYWLHVGYVSTLRDHSMLVSCKDAKILPDTVLLYISEGGIYT